MKHRKSIFKYIVLIIIITAVNMIDVYAIETVINVSFDSNLPPYQFYDGEKYSGLHIDVIENIAKKNDYILNYIPKENFRECLKSLEIGESDIILGAKNSSIDINKTITSYISQSQIIMISPKDKAFDVKNRSLDRNIVTIMEINSIEYPYIERMKELSFIVEPNQISAFNKFLYEDADALIGIKDSILYLLDKKNLTDEFVIISNFMTTSEYGIVLKKDNTELLNRLNREIVEMKISGTYEKIYENWVVNNISYTYDNLISNIIFITFIFLFFFFIYYIINHRINKILKDKVNVKTEELIKVNKNLENKISENRYYNELKDCIVSNSPFGILVFDLGYKINLSNKSLNKILNLNYNPSNKYVFDVPVVSKIIEKYADRILEDNSTINNEEIQIESKIYRYSIYKLYENTKKVRGAILTIDDITKEKELREQLLANEKHKALNRIIAGIAHEIRNPLTSIKTFIEILPKKINNLKFIEQINQIVPNEVDRVDNLIKNFIDYARPNTSNKEYLEINSIIKSCEILLRQNLIENKINLIIIYKDKTYLYGNKDQLKQVIINIILNSVDAINEKNIKQIKKESNIKIDLWEEENYIYIRFLDKGVGMTKEEIDICTDPFYTNKKGGNGLGLYIVRQYVMENNGTLLIESEKMSFTRVTVKFRRRDAQYNNS